MKTQVSTITAVLFEMLLENSGVNSYVFSGADGNHASIKSVNNIPHPRSPVDSGKLILNLDDGSFFTITVEPGLK